MQALAKRAKGNCWPNHESATGAVNTRTASCMHGTEKRDLGITPDGKYFVVRGRLWRMSNPALPEDVRAALTKQLMDARRALRRDAPLEGRAEARQTVELAKTALGERGPVWWKDGASDFNRKMARNTPYAEWFAPQGDEVS